jgi:predicted nuclease with TOPRIM domain
MSMLPDLLEFCGLYSAKYPDTQNPFEPVVSPAARMESREPLPFDTSTHKPAERNLLEPSEVITVIRDCFDKLGTDLAKKDSEIETLRKRIMQSNSDRHQLDEGKEIKRKAMEELREKIGDLRDEISALNTTVRGKDEAIATIQKDNARLDHDVKSREAIIAELTNKHEQDINQLVQRIDSVSDHKVGELKRSIEIDLKPDFDELSHLPNDESCLFHMDILESIFRKLRQKGIEIGGGQK